MKSIVGITLLIGITVATIKATAEQPNHSPVQYQVPASWKLLKNDATGGNVHTITLEVPEGPKAADDPVVMLKTYKLPPGLRMDDINLAEVAKAVIPNGVPVSAANDGPNWRTGLFLGHIDNAKLVALYRIGIQDGYVAEEAFIFPMATTKSEELALLTIYGQAEQEGRTSGVYAPLQSTYKTISQFNEFTKTVGINGPTPFNARAVMATPSQKPTAVYRWSGQPSSTRSAGS